MINLLDFEAFQNWFDESHVPWADCDSETIAWYFVKAGYVSENAINYLRWQFENSDVDEFCGYLDEIGVEKRGDQTVVIGLLTKLTPASLCPYCICFCESDLPGFEEARAVKLQLTTKGFVCKSLCNQINSSRDKSDSL